MRDVRPITGEMRERYLRARRDFESDDETGSLATLTAALASGFLLGGGMPACAALVEVLIRKAYPDQGFPVIYTP